MSFYFSHKSNTEGTIIIPILQSRKANVHTQLVKGVKLHTQLISAAGI